VEIPDRDAHTLWKSLVRGMPTPCGKSKLRGLYHSLPAPGTVEAEATTLSTRFFKRSMGLLKWGLTAQASI